MHAGMMHAGMMLAGMMLAGMMLRRMQRLTSELHCGAKGREGEGLHSCTCLRGQLSCGAKP
eukprot:1152583-Pelagomonas_calceolata.AAC.1